VRIEGNPEVGAGPSVKDGVWSEAPWGMIGLRLSPESRVLTAAEILALPL
jgi:hypothetical protein